MKKIVKEISKRPDYVKEVLENNKQLTEQIITSNKEITGSLLKSVDKERIIRLLETKDLQSEHIQRLIE